MKIALYIEDGLEQVVLTPESETEESILEKLHDGSREISLKRGTFYGCRGGWTRHRDRYETLHGVPENKDDSTMIVLRPPQKETAPEKAVETRSADPYDFVVGA